MPTDPAILYISNVINNPKKWTVGQNTQQNGPNLTIAKTKKIVLKKDINDRIIICVNFLKSKGYSLNGIAGLLGNLLNENSTLEPSRGEDNPVVKGSRGGYGIAQWTGPRRIKLERNLGRNLNNLNSQLEFLVNELNNDFPTLNKILKNSNSTVYKTTYDVLYDFENPLVKNLNPRLNSANYILELIKENNLF
jgi:hypothetical protein